MRRINIHISDEANKAIDEKLLPHGMKEHILGMVIEDWIAWCEEDPQLAQRYIGRELGLRGSERVLINKEELVFIIRLLEALPESLQTGAKPYMTQWRKEFNL